LVRMVLVGIAAVASQIVWRNLERVCVSGLSIQLPGDPTYNAGAPWSRFVPPKVSFRSSFIIPLR
jgi:hypothetical protein